MKKLRNTEAESKKGVAYIKKRIVDWSRRRNKFLSKNWDVYNRVRENEWGLCIHQINPNEKYLT